MPASLLLYIMGYISSPLIFCRSGSGEIDLPPNVPRRSSPETPAESEEPLTCTCDPSGAAASCNCPQLSRPLSPPHSIMLPASHFYQRQLSGDDSRNKDNGGKSKSKKSSELHRLPRYLWAAFGKVGGPLKRHLRRRRCGQRAKRAFPWSKASCVSSLFSVQWFEAASGEDEINKLMGAIASPRPNRASRRSQTTRGVADLAAPGLSGDVQDGRSPPVPKNSRGHRQLLSPDIAEERHRRLSFIREEEEEERDDLAAEREFAHQNGAALPANGEFELVDRDQNSERQLVHFRPGRRKPEVDTENVSKSNSQQVDKSSTSSDDQREDAPPLDPLNEDDVEGEEEDVHVFSHPVRRRLF